MKEELRQVKAAVPNPAEVQALKEQLAQAQGELSLLLPLPPPLLAPQPADPGLCTAKAGELEETLKE